MKRRDFFKKFLLFGSLLYLPKELFAYDDKLIEQIEFSKEDYQKKSAQTIIIFTYGGASQLGGNLSNIDEIEALSQNSYYDYFRGLTKTKRECWQEAGGSHMEAMIDSSDMTLFRCCYSKTREINRNKSHGKCVSQNQRGSYNFDHPGIISILSKILFEAGMIDENTLMPFITMENESIFYAKGDLYLPRFLEPVGLDERFQNPYKRYDRWWFYYTPEERKIGHYNDRVLGFEPLLSKNMDILAQSLNKDSRIKSAFARREKLSDFIEKIKNSSVPDLGELNYSNDTMANKLKTAVTILLNNPDTKIITLGTEGLGGWDDHSEAREYVYRMETLFLALRSALAHIKAAKRENINIMVFGEFGRNVNLNSSFGWDHGNLQNLYIIGGNRYFSHKGILGETEVVDEGKVNRLYLHPKSYQIDPMSIASTLYKIYGTKNPEVLNGFRSIEYI